MTKYHPIVKVIEEDYEIPHLGATRKISALLPYDYNENEEKRYPVLYMQDGQNLFNPKAPFGDWAIDKSLEKMAKEGLKDVIIIAIDHGERERIYEYLPFYHPRFGKGKGKHYIQFMKEKLISYVNKNYRTLTDYENTGIGGSSMGGLISLYAGLHEPEVFGKLMIFSPSLWISKMIFKLARNFKPLPKTKIYVYAGGRESEEHLPNVKNLESILNDKIHESLLFDIEVSVNKDGHHSEMYWRHEFPKALKWLFFNNDMKYTQSKTIDPATDLIIPVRKGNIQNKNLPEYIKGDLLDFKGNAGESHSLYSAERKIYLVGLGDENDASRIHKSFQKFTFKKKKFWSEKIQLDCSGLSSIDVKLAVQGMEMACYNMGVFKTADEQSKDLEITLVRENDMSKEIDEGHATGDSINNIRGLIDAPANVKTPEYLAEWARQSASRFHYECQVKEKAALEEEGFGAILAVGSGSNYEPRLITVSHMPKKDAPVDIALVGKGITFDSGGLSIKGSQNLHYLKSDMGGAAVVLGAVELAARLNLNVNVIGMVASAENAVDAKSFRPSDVIKSYSGKTIEVIDTDAEGRLVLADALSYTIRNHKPKYIIDLATLTGSVVRTLAYSAAGLFTENDELAGKLSHLGESIQERVWRLPMYKEFEADLHSDIADIRNFSNKPIAGAIMAAKFLEAFTEDHENWVHLDIAGVAFGDSEFSKMKSATGYGVRLMVEFIKTLQ